jgi:hypothetical protein
VHERLLDLDHQQEVRGAAVDGEALLQGQVVDVEAA